MCVRDVKENRSKVTFSGLGKSHYASSWMLALRIWGPNLV